MENETPLDIVFMPSQEVFDFAILQCSQIAKDYEVLFNLDGFNNFPHITIYQLNIPQKNLDNLIKKLDELVKSFNPLSLQFTEYETHDGNIGVSFLASDQVRDIQRKIIENTNDFREGLKVIDENSDKAKSFSDEQKELIKKYGFENILEFYSPHITVTKIVNIDQADSLIQTLNWPFGVFKSSAIGLYERGRYGTCNRLIKEFKLGVVG